MNRHLPHSVGRTGARTPARRKTRRFQLAGGLLVVIGLVLARTELAAQTLEAHPAAQPELGVLDISTEPAGASVLVGTRVRKTAPAIFEQLPAGKHKLIISLDDYVTQTLDVEVKVGGTVRTNVVLQTIREWLQQTKHPGVTIWIKDLKVGSFPTITEALQAATPGARLVVAAGYYPESLLIDRPLELVGDDLPENTLVESARGPCLVLRSPQAIIRGLTLKGGPGPGSCAVEVAHGQSLLDKCYISSASLAGVGLHGPESQATLENCVVRATEQAGGLLIYDHAVGKLEGCEFAQAGGVGIEVRDQAQLTLNHCQIYDCRQAGLLVHRQGVAQLEYCEIASNRLAGAEVGDDGMATLNYCSLLNGKASGAFIHGPGHTQFSDCDISGNAFSGVEIREGANPQLQSCRIDHNQQNGILVLQNGAGKINACDVFNNFMAGLEIRSGGDPQVFGTKIRNGFSAGLLVHQGGKGQLESCEIINNSLAGAEIGEDGNPRLLRCKIIDGLGAGVLVRDGGQAHLENCAIMDNRAQGVEIRDHGNPVLVNCDVTGNALYGVYAHQGAAGRLEGGSLTGNLSGPQSVSEDSALEWAGPAEDPPKAAIPAVEEEKGKVSPPSSAAPAN